MTGQTAQLIRGARTDPERAITYEPERRPEVSNLLLLGSLCLETRPEALAEEIGAAGSAALKRLVTDAINDRLRPIRRKRHEIVGEAGFLQEILAEGADRARAIGDGTLESVRQLMHNSY